MLFPHMGLKTKLILSYSIIIMAGVLLSAVVGIALIANTIVRQARDKVRLDLNSAREIYQQEGEIIGTTVGLIAQRIVMTDAADPRRRTKLAGWLEESRRQESLDILTLTDETGRVLVRARNPDAHGDQYNNMMVHWLWWSKQPVVATEVVTSADMAKESPDLTAQARIRIIGAPRSIPTGDTVETRGLMIKAAAPVLNEQGRMIGILYGGRLLNQNYQIVDRVRNILYRGQRYQGRDIGAATIFLDDYRVATNVAMASGERAVGTRASAEIHDQVVNRGVRWVGRAYAVNGWYIAAYEPIRNISGRAIGMLYVGMLEAPYVRLRNRAVLLFSGVAVLTIVLLWFTANLTSGRIVRPVKELVRATGRVAAGDLAVRVPIASQDEIGQLAGSFNLMAGELEKATQGYHSLTRTLEQKVEEKTAELRAAQDQLVQNEKLSSLGKMAAGIAHEINNPLTSILLNSHLLEERLPDDPRIRESILLIIEETSRCSAIVKGLLEFSRQSLQEKAPADLNQIVDKTLLLFESQIVVNHVAVDKQLDRTLPRIVVDANKIKQVFANIIINAVESMATGGRLTITSKVSPDGRSLEMEFRDTGIGMDPETAARMFDPFFTTKGTRGTGLGLSISYGIIKQHQGDIAVDSRPGLGTAITARLPIEETNTEEDHNA